MPQKVLIIECLCGKPFKRTKTHGKRKKACSRECYFRQIRSKQGEIK